LTPDFLRATILPLVGTGGSGRLSGKVRQLRSPGCLAAGADRFPDSLVKLGVERPPQPFVGEPASHGKQYLDAAPIGGGLDRAGCIAEPDREPIVADSNPKGIEHTHR